VAAEPALSALGSRIHDALFKGLPDLQPPQTSRPPKPLLQLQHRTSGSLPPIWSKPSLGIASRPRRPGQKGEKTGGDQAAALAQAFFPV